MDLAINSPTILSDKHLIGRFEHLPRGMKFKVCCWDSRVFVQV